MLTITIEPLTPQDWPAVHELLRAARLPLEGFGAPHVDRLIARDGELIVGAAAVEMYAPYGLLRSVVVADSHRGRKVGLQLTRAAIARAEALGLHALYLLTETAPAFFPKFGFAPVARADIPHEVKQSVEFTSACPASAQAFHLSLKRSPQ
jgi:amino-acid N-acetyltransferase